MNVHILIICIYIFLFKYMYTYVIYLHVLGHDLIKFICDLKVAAKELIA